MDGVGSQCQMGKGSGMVWTEGEGRDGSSVPPPSPLSCFRISACCVDVC